MKFLALFTFSLLVLLVSGRDLPKGRILNGQDSDYVPYVCMVSGYNNEYGTFGGGSFITLSHVLTAGNLIHKMHFWYVDYGRETLGGLPYESANGILHPGYDADTFENNIGILVLNQPADSSEYRRSC